MKTCIRTYVCMCTSDIIYFEVHFVYIRMYTVHSYVHTYIAITRRVQCKVCGVGGTATKCRGELYWCDTDAYVHAPSIVGLKYCTSKIIGWEHFHRYYGFVSTCIVFPQTIYSQSAFLSFHTNHNCMNGTLSSVQLRLCKHDGLVLASTARLLLFPA